MHLLCNIIVRNKQIVEFISVKSEQNLSIQAEKKSQNQDVNRIGLKVCFDPPS